MGIVIDSSYTFPEAESPCHFGRQAPFNGSKWFGKVLEVALSDFYARQRCGPESAKVLDLGTVGFAECRARRSAASAAPGRTRWWSSTVRASSRGWGTTARRRAARPHRGPPPQAPLPMAGGPRQHLPRADLRTAGHLGGRNDLSRQGRGSLSPGPALRTLRQSAHGLEQPFLEKGVWRQWPLIPGPAPRSST